MDTTAIIFFCIIAIIILALLFWQRLSRWTYRKILWFKPSEMLFQLAVTALLFFATIIFTLYISGRTDMVNMNTLWLILFVFLALAIIYAVRIKIEPKDTSVSDLTKAIRQLTVITRVIAQKLGVTDEEINQSLKEDDERKKR